MATIAFPARKQVGFTRALCYGLTAMSMFSPRSLVARAAMQQPVDQFKSEVVYQIYPRSFADANGDGIGDLRGITKKIDYLAKLGVDVIWLCPVNRTTNYDNGYDISDYLDIDPSFGTLRDWEALRDGLHQRGMKLMMDLVLNHTSDEHPWFLQDIRRRSLERGLATYVASPQGRIPKVQHALNRFLLGQTVGEKIEKNSDLLLWKQKIETFRKESKQASQTGYTPVGQQLQAMAYRLLPTLHPEAQQRLPTVAEQDFYFWREKPNNWTSIFSGSAWHYVPQVDAYYLALFSAHQPDLDWSNDKVRAAMIDTVRIWIKRGVDGFRLDSIGFLGKRTGLPDALPTDTNRTGRGMDHFINQPQVHVYLQELLEVLNVPGLRTVGEISFSPIEAAIDYAGFERKELSEVFVFDHMYVDMEKDKWHPIPFDLRRFKHVIRKQQEVIHGKSWLGNYLENHDQLRSISRFADDKIFRVESGKMLATLLLTLEGTPYIYQGQEIGMTNSQFQRIDDIDDIEARNYYDTATKLGEPEAQVMAQVSQRNRDHVRTVMQWNDKPYAGFSTIAPWIKVNPNYQLINVHAAEKDKQSILHFYRDMIQIRKKNPVLIDGQFQEWFEDHPDVFVYTREKGSQRALIILSFTRELVSLPPSFLQQIGGQPQLAMANYPTDSTPHGTITLRPFESRLYLWDVAPPILPAAKTNSSLPDKSTP